jgi:hypothetical protein
MIRKSKCTISVSIKFEANHLHNLLTEQLIASSDLRPVNEPLLKVAPHER